MALDRNKYSNLEGVPDFPSSVEINNTGDTGTEIMVNNTPTFIHVKYSNDGYTFTDNNGEEPGSWLGICVNETKEDPDTFHSYKWSRIKGKDGEPGKPGLNSFIHVAYASNEDGTSGFNFTNGDYIGTCVTTDRVAPTDPTLYSWKRKTGIGTLTGFVFKRALERPNRPVGGSYDDPNVNTDGWSDGIPEGTEPVWMSRRLFSQDGSFPQEDEWSLPQLLSKDGVRGTDGSLTLFQFSHVASTNDADWHYPAVDGDVYMRTKFCPDGVCDTETWSEPARFKGETGVSTVQGFVFKRSLVQPSKPVGGSYFDPNVNTDGWHDGIPEGEDPVWMSKRLFTADGQEPQQPEWSSPTMLSKNGVRGTDGSLTLFEFSHVASTNDADWHYPAEPDDVYMRTMFCQDGVCDDESWGPAVKIKGENGDNVEFEYSEILSENDEDWHFPPTINDKYMRTRTCPKGNCVGIEWSSPVNIKGDDGERGNININVIIKKYLDPKEIGWNNNTDLFLSFNTVDIDELLDAFLLDQLNLTPKDNDQINSLSITELDENNNPVYKNETYIYKVSNGIGTWLNVAFKISGDAIIEGTVAGDKFIAGTEIISPKITSGDIVGGTITGGTFKAGDIISEDGTFSISKTGNIVGASLTADNITGGTLNIDRIPGMIKTYADNKSISFQDINGLNIDDVTNDHFQGIGTLNGVAVEAGEVYHYFENRADGDVVLKIDSTPFIKNFQQNNFKMTYKIWVQKWNSTITSWEFTDTAVSAYSTYMVTNHNHTIRIHNYAGNLKYYRLYIKGFYTGADTFGFIFNNLTISTVKEF